jgi:predicted nicotinamide N-methyase
VVLTQLSQYHISAAVRASFVLLANQRRRRRLLLLSDLFYGKDMHQKHILATKNNSPNKSRRLLSALVCRQNTPAL